MRNRSCSCDSISERPCTLVIAGGKRVLIGAPAGLGQALRSEDLRQLDAVIVTSLMAADLEGLDEVRNTSWHAGRDEPLLVIGPPGIETVVTALNKAYEAADALHTVEQGAPAGGYDAAVLTPRMAVAEKTVFGTGDLEISRELFGYRIYYVGNRKVRIAACNWFERTTAELAPSDDTVTIGCARSDAAYSWPLTAPIFVEN